MKKLLLALSLFLLSLTAADAAARFGICTATCTWDGASTAMWSATSGGATGASVPVAGDSVTFDAATCVGGVTCTITVNTDFNISTLTMGACTASTTGCVLDFSVNNNSPTLTGSFNATGTGTRQVKLGSGTFTLGGTAAWTFTTTTNLTFNAGTSTLNLSGVTGVLLVAFNGGGLTYNNVNLLANKAASILGANTFTNLNITGPNFVQVANNVTQTVTNAFNFNGSSSNPITLFVSGLVTPAATINVASGSAVCNWCALHGMTFTGGASFAATNSLDMALNTGITITPPSGGTSAGHIIGGGI